LAATRLGRDARWTIDKLEGILRYRRRAQVRRWRERWQANLDGFLSVVVAGQAADPASFIEGSRKVAEALPLPLPPDLQAERISVPTPFRRLDLTHFDVLALGQNFVRRFPDRSQAILLLGDEFSVAAAVTGSYRLRGSVKIALRCVFFERRVRPDLDRFLTDRHDWSPISSRKGLPQPQCDPVEHCFVGIFLGDARALQDLEGVVSTLHDIKIGRSLELFDDRPQLVRLAERVT
jgi:hypothetical protein